MRTLGYFIACFKFGLPVGLKGITRIYKLNPTLISLTRILVVGLYNLN